MVELNKLKEVYLGKEVHLYPNDSISKYGIIEDINDKGIIIKITEVGSQHTSHKVDDIYFISFSNNLTFKLRRE